MAHSSSIAILETSTSTCVDVQGDSVHHGHHCGRGHPHRHKELQHRGDTGELPARGQHERALKILQILQMDGQVVCQPTLARRRNKKISISLSFFFFFLSYLVTTRSQVWRFFFLLKTLNKWLVLIWAIQGRTSLTRSLHHSLTKSYTEGKDRHQTDRR